MEVKAVGKNIGVSRIKATIPVDIIRHMNAEEAVAVLTYMQKGAALPVKKLIESAMSNAKNNLNLDPSTLYITEIKVNKGPQTKMNTRRMKPGAKGRAKFFDRKYCHITVVLSDRQADAVAAKKEAKAVKTKEVSEKKETKVKVKKSSTKSTKKAD